MTKKSPSTWDSPEVLSLKNQTKSKKSAYNKIKIKISTEHNRNFKEIIALVDTGNSIQDFDVVISRNLAQKLKINFLRSKYRISTADRQAAKLECYVTDSRIYILIPDTKKKVMIEKILIAGDLAEDLIIGEHLLKKLKTIIDYSTPNPTIKMVPNTKPVQLINVLRTTKEDEFDEKSLHEGGKKTTKEDELDEKNSHEGRKKTTKEDKFKHLSYFHKYNVYLLKENFNDNDLGNDLRNDLRNNLKNNLRKNVDSKILNDEIKNSLKSPFKEKNVEKDSSNHFLFKETARINLMIPKARILKAHTINRIPLQMVESTTLDNDDGILVEEQEIDGKTKIIESVTEYSDGNIIAYITAEKTTYIPKNTKIVAQIIKKEKIKPNKEKESSRETINQLQKSKNEEPLNFQMIWEKLRLDKNPIIKPGSASEKSLKRVINENLEVFTPTDRIGSTDLVECEITLKENIKPIRQRLRPMNPKDEENVKQQLDSWIQDGVIEPSKSPWASPMVPVLKKNGDTRWCIDFRLLNKSIKMDSYPLPIISNLLERAGGQRYYSSMDAKQAYHCIKMSKASRELTAFISPHGLYQFLRMPFGLSISPGVYSRFIAAALNHLGRKNINCYLDDVIIFTWTLKEHIEKLGEVLRAHKEAGIRLNPEKTHLLQTKVEYLGYQLSEEGISMVPSYVQQILNWPSPKTGKECASVIGFLSYYSSFIPEFSMLTAEMNAAKNKKDFKWTETMEKKFLQLKEEFKKSPIRAAPMYDSDQPFEITTDFSSTAISCILSQVQQGKERMIAAAGRKCSPTESNYPSWKGEMLALVYGIRKFSHILSFRRFKVNTDSRALAHLSTLKPVKGMTSRWLEELSGFDFEVKHRKGSLNKNADALSRATHLPEAEESECFKMIQEIQQVLKEEKEVPDFLNSIALIEEEGDIDEGEEQLPEENQSRVNNEDMIEDDHTVKLNRKLIKEKQEIDPHIKIVKNWIINQSIPTRKELKHEHRDLQDYRRLADSMIISEDGILEIKVHSILNESSRIIVIPASLRSKVFEDVHQHPSMGHFGEQATLSRARLRFYYPSMHSQLIAKVAACPECLAKYTAIKIRTGKHIPHVSGYPLQMLSIDLVGPLTETEEKNIYILTVQDNFSKWVNLYPIRNKESRTVVEALLKFVNQFGCPYEVHSDQGKEFTSTIFSMLMKKMGIKQTTTPPYNPNSNPCERFHRTLSAIMRTKLPRFQTDWEKYLGPICLAYNSKIHTTTGVTPALAFLGREINMPLDMMTKIPVKYPNVGTYIEEVLENYNKIFPIIAEKQNSVFRRNARLYEPKEKFDEKEKVMVYLTRSVKGKTKKFTNGWCGPFSIKKQISEQIYKVEGLTNKNNPITMLCHRSRIKSLKTVDKIPENIRIEDSYEDIGKNQEEISDVHTEAEMIPEEAFPINIPKDIPEIIDIPITGTNYQIPVSNNVTKQSDQEVSKGNMDISQEDEEVENYNEQDERMHIEKSTEVNFWTPERKMKRKLETPEQISERKKMMQDEMHNNEDQEPNFTESNFSEPNVQEPNLEEVDFQDPTREESPIRVAIKRSPEQSQSANQHRKFRSTSLRRNLRSHVDTSDFTKEQKLKFKDSRSPIREPAANEGKKLARSKIGRQMKIFKSLVSPTIEKPFPSEPNPNIQVFPNTSGAQLKPKRILPSPSTITSDRKETSTQLLGEERRDCLLGKYKPITGIVPMSQDMQQKESNEQEAMLESKSDAINKVDNSSIHTLNENIIYTKLTTGKIPRKATEGSAGYDMFPVNNIELMPFSHVLAPTGIHLAIPQGLFVQIQGRSSLAKRGITVFPGVLDSDYRGEVKIILINQTPTPQLITKNHAIAQGIVNRIENSTFLQTNELEGDDNLHPGFGSTDRS